MYLHAENWETVQANANKFDIHSRAAIRGKKNIVPFSSSPLQLMKLNMKQEILHVPPRQRIHPCFFSNIRVLTRFPEFEDDISFQKLNQGLCINLYRRGLSQIPFSGLRSFEGGCWYADCTYSCVK